MTHSLAALLLAGALTLSACDFSLNTTWWCNSGGALPDPSLVGGNGRDRICSDDEIRVSRENGTLDDRLPGESWQP